MIEIQRRHLQLRAPRVREGRIGEDGIVLQQSFDTALLLIALQKLRNLFIQNCGLHH